MSSFSMRNILFTGKRLAISFPAWQPLEWHPRVRFLCWFNSRKRHNVNVAIVFVMDTTRPTSDANKNNFSSNASSISKVYVFLLEVILYFNVGYTADG